MAFMSMNKKINSRQKNRFPSLLNFHLELPYFISRPEPLSVYSFHKNEMRTHNGSGTLLDAEATKMNETLSCLCVDYRLPAGEVDTCTVSV